MRIQGLYALFAGPLFDSAADPDANVKALRVIVCTADTGFVGGFFTNFWQTYGTGSWVANNGALPITPPGIALQAACDPADLTEQVRSNNAWAALYVRAGASADLYAALAAGPSTTYDPSTAVVLVWDEARNNQVATARIAGPLKGLTGAFSLGVASMIAEQMLYTPLGASVTTAWGATPASRMALAELLAAPVWYSELSLYPFTAPVMNQALTVGQVRMRAVRTRCTVWECRAHLYGVGMLRGECVYVELGVRRLHSSRVCSGSGGNRRGCVV